MKKVLMGVVSAAAMVVSAAESVRYEALSDGCPIVVTGTELRGELDGSAVTEWNTLLSEDGWLTLSSGGASADVLVLNTPKVLGGRLAANETWGADRIRVVRSDVIVPNGVTLTLSAGCNVKFLPGAKIVAEDGGAIRAEGAMLADFADDSVGGDTNLDEDKTAPSGTEWWMESPAVAALAAVSFFDGTENAVPRRVYSVGTAYGELPALHKDGLLFGGWFTAPNGAGTRVTAQTAASASVSALYAQWTPFTIGLEPAELVTTALSGAFSFAVSANGPWTATTEAGWITLTAMEGEGDGEVAFTLAQNASTEVRSATIRVTLANGGSQDFTVTQEGMTAVATPVINPVDGMTFSGSARRCSVSCATDGASIYYTLDGSEPDEASKLYPGKSFNVFDSVTIKAKAFKEGMLPSETVVSRVIRLQTLAEAIDQPLWAVTSGGDAEWGVTIDETADGKSAAQSGTIGDDEASWMQTTVEGSGTLAFQWKVVCEDDPDSVEDDPYSYTWDYLELAVDESVVCRIDGDSGWQKVSVKVKGEGTHTVRWTYVKDYMQDDYTLEDGAWVDQVTWAPVVGDAEVPKAWLDSLGVAGAGGSTDAVANSDMDGDGFTAAEEYVMGSDPNDPESRLTASIEFVNGKPVITYTPNLLDDRKYIKWGKKDLADPTEEWTPVLEGQEDNYNFFKVSVEMP